MGRMNQVSGLGKDTSGFLIWYQMIWFVLQVMNHSSATDPEQGGLGDVEGRRPGKLFGENTEGEYRNQYLKQ